MRVDAEFKLIEFQGQIYNARFLRDLHGFSPILVAWTTIVFIVALLSYLL